MTDFPTAGGRPVRAGLAAIPLCLMALAAHGAQPTWTTPAAVPQSAAILYTIPYAVSTQPSPLAPPGFPDGETVVTIGGKLLGSAACAVQVEWVDWNGTVVGYSQPIGAPAIGGNDT